MNGFLHAAPARTTKKFSIQHIFERITVKRRTVPEKDMEMDDCMSPSTRNAHSPKTGCAEFCPCHSTLHDYEHVRPLGAGSFATVQLVRNKHTGERYALKVMTKERVKRLKQVRHVYYEKDILLTTDCPFTVRGYRTFQDDNYIYFLMEYVPGGELLQHLHVAGSFDTAQALFVGAEVLLAIKYLHSRGIIYRDLKPENILLTATGHIKLTDFGLSKPVDDQTWTTCGTPEYLAPEVISGSGHGRPADWWSFGILLYEMLVGRTPFRCTTTYQTYNSIIHSAPLFQPSMDPDARDLITKLLQKNPRKRPTVEQIQRHAFFAAITSWSDVWAGKLSSPLSPVTVPQEGEAYPSYDSTASRCSTPDTFALF